MSVQGDIPESPWKYGVQTVSERQGCYSGQASRAPGQVGEAGPPKPSHRALSLKHVVVLSAIGKSHFLLPHQGFPQFFAHLREGAPSCHLTPRLSKVRITQGMSLFQESRTDQVWGMKS